MLSADGAGSVQVIGRMLQGRMPGTPRLAFEIVDVREAYGGKGATDIRMAATSGGGDGG